MPGSSSTSTAKPYFERYNGLDISSLHIDSETIRRHQPFTDCMAFPLTDNPQADAKRCADLVTNAI